MACQARSKYDQNVMPSGLLEALEDNFIKNKICSEVVSFQGPYWNPRAEFGYTILYTCTIPYNSCVPNGLKSVHLLKGGVMFCCLVF